MCGLSKTLLVMLAGETDFSWGGEKKKKNTHRLEGFVILFPHLLASLVVQAVKNLHHAGDPGSIPGWGRSPGDGNGNPLQYFCLENFMDRQVRQATVHGIAKSQTQD